MIIEWFSEQQDIVYQHMKTLCAGIAVALNDSQSLCSLVQLIRPPVECGVAAQE
jgi:hypothetical protein